MTLTKSGIIEEIRNRNGFSKKKSTETVKVLLEIIKNTLASGEDVMISRFGKFCVNQKKERRGRNPATGNDLMLSPRKVVKFKWSPSLKERVNK